jgi:hypothetical protein
MHSLLERINAAHKGVRGEAAAGYFSFSHFLYPDAKGGVAGAETGSIDGELSGGWRAAYSSYRYNYTSITCRMDDPACF